MENNNFLNTQVVTHNPFQLNNNLPFGVAEIANRGVIGNHANAAQIILESKQAVGQIIIDDDAEAFLTHYNNLQPTLRLLSQEKRIDLGEQIRFALLKNNSITQGEFGETLIESQVSLRSSLTNQQETFLKEADAVVSMLTETSIDLEPFSKFCSALKNKSINLKELIQRGKDEFLANGADLSRLPDYENSLNTLSNSFSLVDIQGLSSLISGSEIYPELIYTAVQHRFILTLGVSAIYYHYALSVDPDSVSQFLDAIRQRVAMRMKVVMIDAQTINTYFVGGDYGNQVVSHLVNNRAQYVSVSCLVVFGTLALCGSSDSSPSLEEFLQVIPRGGHYSFSDQLSKIAGDALQVFSRLFSEPSKEIAAKAGNDIIQVLDHKK